jgi:predicted nucleic acid-binding Zn ribbon protein
MVYLYRCPDCKDEQEVNHLMSETPEIYCGLCEDTVHQMGEGAPALMKRVITSANFILTGSGYYLTDSASSHKITTPSDVHGTGIETDPRGKAI